jgi:hypothetical protein
MSCGGTALQKTGQQTNLTRYRRELGAWLGLGDAMVSTDHFRQELRAQLGRAASLPFDE